MLAPLSALLAIVLAPAAVVPALGAARPIALGEAVEHAVRSNPTLAMRGADVDIAAGNARSQSGIDDFIIDGSVSWLETRRARDPRNPVQQLALDDVIVALSLTRPLPTGGRVGLRLSGEFIATTFATTSPEGTTELSPSRVYLPSVQLVVAQPLMRGIGPKVARAGLRRSRVVAEAAVLQREAAAAETVRAVVAAWWELSWAGEELSIRSAAAEAARAQLEVTRANIQEGKLPRSAAAEVEVTIARRDEEALLAEQALVDRSLDLRRIAGMEMGPGAVLLSAAEISSDLPENIDFASALDAALARNPQLLAAKTQTRAAAIDVDVTENGLLPQLDFAASAGPTGYSPEPGTALGQLARFEAYTVQASLTLQHAIGRRAAHGAHDAARAMLHRAKLSASDIAAQISMAVARAIGQADIARRRIEALAHSTEAASLDLEAERARFAVGRATNFDVLRRQQGLAEARLRQVRARIDYLKALADVEALTGDILLRHGVAVR